MPSAPLMLRVEITSMDPASVADGMVHMANTLRCDIYGDLIGMERTIQVVARPGDDAAKLAQAWTLQLAKVEAQNLYGLLQDRRQ